MAHVVFNSEQKLVVRSGYLAKVPPLQSNSSSPGTQPPARIQEEKILVFPGLGTRDHVTSGANPAVGPCMTCELRNSFYIFKWLEKMFEKNNIT